MQASNKNDKKKASKKRKKQGDTCKQNQKKMWHIQAQSKKSPFVIRYFVFWFPQCQPEVVNNTIRHSLFGVLISPMPARDGQQHHSPFAISYFDFLNASQNFLNERNVYSSRDKQHHSSFTIRFLGKWMRQGLGVDITIRHSLFLILQLGCPVHAPFIQ